MAFLMILKRKKFTVTENPKCKRKKNSVNFAQSSLKLHLLWVTL